LQKRLEDIENKGMGSAKESKETKRDTQETGGRPAQPVGKRIGSAGGEHGMEKSRYFTCTALPYYL
jgi:hypothetical protein